MDGKNRVDLPVDLDAGIRGVRGAVAEAFLAAYAATRGTSVVYLCLNKDELSHVHRDSSRLASMRPFAYVCSLAAHAASHEKEAAPTYVGFST